MDSQVEVRIIGALEFELFELDADVCHEPQKLPGKPWLILYWWKLHPKKDVIFSCEDRWIASDLRDYVPFFNTMCFLR